MKPPSKIKRQLARLQKALEKKMEKKKAKALKAMKALFTTKAMKAAAPGTVNTFAEAMKGAAPVKKTVNTFAKVKGAAPVKKTVNTFAKVKKGHDSGYKEMLEKFMVITKPCVVVVVP